MDKDYTHITVVLDRSGSMEVICDDTIGGFNAFLETQSAAPGRATMTLVKFDHEYIVACDCAPLNVVMPLDRLNFVPRGSTALLDAIGRAINDTGAALAAMPEAKRPARVVFVIVTDGLENASREFKRERIRSMIEHQTKQYAWEFVYLGANQDAIAVAEQIAVAAPNAMTYAANSEGTMGAFASTAMNLSSVRAGTKSDMGYTDEDRAAQTKAGA